MDVIIIASTCTSLSLEETGFQPDRMDLLAVIDELHEAAGRNCYQSWNRPNPGTADNFNYLKNILQQQHHSVLEHGSLTLFIGGVSRTFLAELTRHRHLSFSVLSQRYVDESDSDLIIPPALRDDTEIVKMLRSTHQECKVTYQRIYNHLYHAKGLSKKQAREAARCILPGGTETRIIVTGNIRAWREVYLKRSSPGADKEMQEFAAELLQCLCEVAPHSVQDLVFADDPHDE